MTTISVGPEDSLPRSAKEISLTNGTSSTPTHTAKDPIEILPNGYLPSTSPSPLEDLASTIAGTASAFSSRLTQLGLPQPDFIDPFPPIQVDRQLQTAKFKILQTCEKLMALVLGPTEWLMHQNMAFVEPACIGTALRLGLPDLITTDAEGTPLSELSAQTGASEDLLSRILKVCTQRLVFEEVPPGGRYRHNAISMIMTVPPTAALVDFATDDGFKAAAFMRDTLEKNNWQVPEKQSGSSFGSAVGTEKGIFDYYSEDARGKGERFALAMAGTEMIKTLTEDIYPFHTLPAGSTVVDVGGGIGTVSLRIMQRVLHAKFIVQDQASVVEVADAGADSDRISFMAHNFFEEQPIKGAEVYLFRFILHDHPDSVCVRILRHIVNAMDPKTSRILIDDAVVPDGLGQDSLRFHNFLDLHMLQILNAKERTKGQWDQLIRDTDERLYIDRIWEAPETGTQSGKVIELRLKET